MTRGRFKQTGTGPTFRKANPKETAESQLATKVYRRKKRPVERKMKQRSQKKLVNSGKKTQRGGTTAPKKANNTGQGHGGRVGTSWKR